jgi:hypothetical protein
VLLPPSMTACLHNFPPQSEPILFGRTVDIAVPLPQTQYTLPVVPLILAFAGTAVNNQVGTVTILLLLLLLLRKQRCRLKIVYVEVRFYRVPKKYSVLFATWYLVQVYTKLIRAKKSLSGQAKSLSGQAKSLPGQRRAEPSQGKT